MPAKRKGSNASFPLKLTKGGTTVRVTRLSNGYHRVSYHLGGRRKTEDIKDPEGAIALAKEKLTKLQGGEIDAAQSTDKDRPIYSRALDAISAWG